MIDAVFGPTDGGETTDVTGLLRSLHHGMIMLTDRGLSATGAGVRFDPSIPHPARIYSYWLGGKDHFPADRRAAEEVIRKRPQVVAGARANRAFMARAVRYLAGRGIWQFLDIGTGLPAPGATHQVAQSITPQSRPRPRRQ